MNPTKTGWGWTFRAHEFYPHYFGGFVLPHLLFLCVSLFDPLYFFSCIVCLFLLYCLSFSFVLSVFFRLTASNYPFGISKLFLKQQSTILFMFYLEDNFKWRGFSPQNVKTKTNDDISMISTVTRLKILSNWYEQTIFIVFVIENI